MHFIFPLALFISGAIAGPVERRQLSGSHCNKFCTEQYAPVCGSDGKTYSNMCFFTTAVCYYQEKGQTLTLRSNGACGSTGSATSHTDQSACDQICDEEKSPVCASDGNVYGNKCLFQRAQCEAAKTNTNLFVVVHGDSCPTPVVPECSKYHIDTSDIAVEGGASILPSCPHTFNLICGSDGHTYNNECQLCQLMEQKQLDVTILKNGTCPHGASHGSLDLLNHLLHNQGGQDPLQG